MTIHPLTLDDKYALERGRVFLTGIQALVRLPMMQKRLDRAAGLNTAGFISGYRGSPLGGLDQQLWRAQNFLDAHDVRFQPGVNEDLAATAVWGSQQTNLYAGARYDGVFGMWYGKAPGVDRSGDVFRHANAAGTWGKGGVLAIAGDDHACKSSTLPSQSEFTFMDLEIPILSPSGIQEVLDYGLIGWALSRFAGTWVSMIALAETMDASATVDVAPGRLQIRNPRDVAVPPGGFGLRIGDTPQEQERRLREFRIPAVRAFSRENVLNRVVLDSPNARVGIVACGKSYADLRQAFVDLGLGNKEIARLGLRVFKVGMPWPMDYEPVRRFAEGLETIIVIEEKRDFIETQIRSAIYDLPDARRPRVEGKFDHEGKPLLRAYSIVSPNYEETLEFLSIKVPDGPLTCRLQHIQPGDSIIVGHKPTGTLLIDYLLPGKRLYLFGTGTGLAPFMSIIRDPDTYEKFDQVILVHGCRLVSELAYRDYITQELPRHEFLGELVSSQLRYYPTVTREPFPTQGRIPELIESGRMARDLGLPDLHPQLDRVMLCGSPEMLADTKALLLSMGFSEGSSGEPGEFVIEKAFVEK